MFEYKGSQVERFFNRVEQIPVGEVLTFAQLHEIGLNIQQDRRLIHAVNPKLLEKHQKMLISQRRVGYKMALANEQMEHAWKRKTSATRQIKKALNETVHTDTTNLSADERKTLTDRQLYLTQQLRSLRVRQIASLKVTKQASKATKKASVKADKAVEIQQDALKQTNQLLKEAEEIKKRLEKMLG